MPEYLEYHLGSVRAGIDLARLMIDDMDIAYFRRTKNGRCCRSLKTTEPVQYPVDCSKSCAIEALAIVVQTVSFHIPEHVSGKSRTTEGREVVTNRS